MVAAAPRRPARHRGWCIRKSACRGPARSCRPPVSTASRATNRPALAVFVERPQADAQIGAYLPRRSADRTDGSRRGRNPETKNPGDTAGVVELTTDLLAGFFTWPQAGRLKSPRQAKARLSLHRGQAMPDGFCFIS